MHGRHLSRIATETAVRTRAFCGWVANLSPPLRWRGTPHGTRSFVLLCHDPDAPGGTFRHWAAYDIPGDRVELTEGHGAETLGDGSKQAVNDFGKPGYAGPCPSPGRMRK